MTDHPGAELVPAPPPVEQAPARLDALDQRMRYAQALAQAGILPPAYRRQPASILYALAYADALDLPLPAVLTGLHVMDGRPTMSAQLMGAVVRRAGHRLHVTADDQAATATLTRADDPGHPFVVSFTWADAERAGLADRDTWRRYPRAMLAARATAAVCREGAPDALAGVVYTPDELDPAPEHAPAPAPASPPAPWPTPTGHPEHDPHDDDQAADRPGADPHPPALYGPRAPVTDRQLALLGALLRDLGLTDRPQRIELVGRIVGRPVTSSRDLTRGEASTVLTRLRDQLAADAARITRDHGPTPGEVDPWATPDPHDQPDDRADEGGAWCAACGESLDAALAAAGATTHPGCDPGPTPPPPTRPGRAASSTTNGD